jgi:hypothetical protein
MRPATQRGGGQTQIVVSGTEVEVRTDAPEVGTLLGAQLDRRDALLSRRISNLPMLNAANRPAISQGDAFMNQTLRTTMRWMST